MNEERQVIIPIEQAEIFFYEEAITAVRLDDGRIGAVISQMCKVIGVDRAGQVQRIRNDETIAHNLVITQIRTKGALSARRSYCLGHSLLAHWYRYKTRSAKATRGYTTL